MPKNNRKTAQTAAGFQYGATSQELKFPRRFQPTAFDCGNGRAKLIIGGAEILSPSYFAPVHSDIYDIPDIGDGSYIEYISGDRDDLIGDRWMTGLPAYLTFPGKAFSVVDDRKGKIKYGLQMFLGTVGSYLDTPEQNYSIMLSIQDAKAFGDEMAQAFHGTHEIKINRELQSRLVTINVLGVLEEGVGAIATARSYGLVTPRSQVIMIDLGYGTTIASVFSSSKLLHRSVINGGVSDLISAIATNIDLRRELSREGDKQIVQEGIEKGSFIYGSTGYNFQSIYQTELRPWVQQNLAKALKAVDEWRDNAEIVIGCGGGCSLPSIAQLLGINNISVLYEPSWANARGLAALAKIKEAA